MFQVNIICFLLSFFVMLPQHCEVGGTTIAERRSKLQQREKRETPESGRWCGLPGRDGRDGRDGIQGPYGPPGQKGESGNIGRIEKMEQILQSLKTEISDVLQKQVGSQNVQTLSATECKQNIDQHVTRVNGQDKLPRRSHTPSGGAVYTRWGRNICPGDNEKLYHGVVVGSHYQHAGSGANYLCLPLNPQWNRTVAGHQSKSYIYGTEFEISESNTGFRRQNAGGKLQHDHDAQCSVCHVPTRQTQVMIPARLECPAGWTLEYIGFLMSAHHEHKRSEYVCVDEDPDAHPGSSPNENGALLYITEIVCGSLPCPPFASGFEVTCVVCTK